MGRVVGVVVDGLMGDLAALLQPQGPAGVGIDIESGPIAAADVQADPVPFFKDVGCGVKLKDEFIGLPGLHQLRVLIAVSVPGPNDGVGQVDG